MSKSQIFPESHYEFSNMSWCDILRAYNKHKTITGIVEKILPDEQELLVKLGEKLYGRLPFSEVTIYPCTYSSNPERTLPIQIYTLLDKQIRVKVTGLYGITLSRKKNMHEAYKHLSTCSTALLHITSATPYFAFGDIGDGIIARMSIKEVCKSRIKSVTDYFHIQDKIWVKILDVDELKRFNVSHKAACAEYNPEDYKRGDVCSVTICGPVDEIHSGYFANVAPNVVGIVDAYSHTPLLQYGTKVECFVCTANEVGLKLRFIRIIA